MFNAIVFSVPAVPIESKMIIFTSELRPYAQQSAKRIGEVNCCNVSDFFFQVNFAYDYAFVWKMAVLL